MTQTLQAFFDSPLALEARHNLSASAAEPLTQAELFAFEPDAAEGLFEVALGYPERYGPEFLRARVAQRYAGVDADGVILSSGLDDGLAMLYCALLEPGDRAVVLMPCYPPQVQLARWRGGQVTPWIGHPENGWRPDLDELRELVSTPTRLVLVTFPQNPTGFMPDRNYLDELLEIVSASGALLIADEIYAGLPPLDDDRVTGLAGRSENAISLHGLSKTCGLPGLRVGWIASRNAAAMDAIRDVRNLFNAYLPSPVTYMADLALRHEHQIIDRNTAIVRANETLAHEFFARRANLFEWLPPSAGVLSFPKWLGSGGACALSDRLLKEAALTFAPSTCFDAGDQNLRLSTARRSFADALSALDEFIDSRL